VNNATIPVWLLATVRPESKLGFEHVTIGSEVQFSIHEANQQLVRQTATNPKLRA